MANCPDCGSASWEDGSWECGTISNRSGTIQSTTCQLRECRGKVKAAEKELIELVAATWGCRVKEHTGPDADEHTHAETVAEIESQVAELGELAALRQELTDAKAALATVKLTTVRTVPVEQAEGPYRDSGLTDVLYGDWELIKAAQAAGEPNDRS